jgi:hypothetical protein
MATGGIVPRFAGEDTSLVTEPISGVAYPYTTPEEYMTRKQNLADTRLKDIEERLSPEEKAFRERTAERLSGLDLKKNKAERMNAALAFLEAGSTVGGLGTAAIAGSKKYMLGQADIEKNYTDMQDNLMKSAAEQKAALRKDAAGDAAGALAASEKAAEYGQKAKVDADKLAFDEKQLASIENRETLKRENELKIARIQKTITPTEKERLATLLKGKSEVDRKAILDNYKDASAALNTTDDVAKIKADAAIPGEALKLIQPGGSHSKAYRAAQNAGTGEAYIQALIESLRRQQAGGSPTIPPPAPNKGKVDSNNPLLGGKS